RGAGVQRGATGAGGNSFSRRLFAELPIYRLAGRSLARGTALARQPCALERGDARYRPLSFRCRPVILARRDGTDRRHVFPGGRWRDRGLAWRPDTVARHRPARDGTVRRERGRRMAGRLDRRYRDVALGLRGTVADRN